ncbi:histidine phosphatase family protein [Labedella endophytica]|uniref:Histidine phosphatase family protein n=1 Tax=Labedella endophytica TaxID=1523160 RepID=A0A433JWS9_9MICO|nr:histidine phosphatase family protein [Labedella endophytica]RUR03414.1 histidine phosphatase family protein [Labedella endophytica]
MPIALIRHGQTDWNAALRIQGSTDIPLNDIGREQAGGIVHRLDASRWDIVVSSPLSRARETAEILAAGLGLELGPAIPELVERGYGEAEGATAEVIRENWPDRQYPGMESEADVQARGAAAIAAIEERFPGRNVLAVSHGTLIRLAVGFVTGTVVASLPNTAIVEIDREGERWVLVDAEVTVDGVEAAVRIGHPAPSAR